MLIKSKQLEFYIIVWLVMFIIVFLAPVKDNNVTDSNYIPDASVEYITEYIPEAKVTYITKEEEPKKKEVKKEPAISKEEKELLAIITMAEAEGESEKGKRLVIDTVLNRVDSKKFPNTITDVIYQRNQFTSTFNGRMDRCYVKKDIYKLVEEELEKRTNSEVLYFTAGKYGEYGTRLFREGNHYFAK